MRTGRTGRLSAVLIRCPRYRPGSAYRPATGWVDSADADQCCQEVQQLMLARETPLITNGDCVTESEPEPVLANKAKMLLGALSAYASASE